MFKANINWSAQQDYCTYEYDMASLVLFEISSTQCTTQPEHNNIALFLPVFLGRHKKEGLLGGSRSRENRFLISG